MSDRGSILISTANDIGEALVEKLGGEGYTPSVWDKEYNKLGIAEVDSAPALSVLEDSSETETARGSILLSTANAIGAMLNKKYNTDRGFKPKEWASAASKLAPLPEKTAESSPVCSIEDGADDVPSRSLVVTITPTLTGISEVVENQAGKNLLNYADMSTSYRVTSITENSSGSFTVVASGLGAYIDHVIKVKAGQVYSIKCTSATNDEGNATQIGAVNVYDGDNSSATLLLDGASINYSPKTFTPTGNYILVRNKVTGGLGAGTGTIVEPRLEIGSTASDYVPYEEPTTYTADLGRTINSGTADIVNGVGSETHKDIDLGSLNWQYDSANTRFFTVDLTSVIKRGTSGWITDLAVSSPYTVASGTANDKTVSEYATTGYVYIKDTDFTDPALFKTSLSGKYLAYPLATPESFTFDGQEIPTKDGYNAFWSDQGNTALDYYGAPEPYTRGTASGGIANVQSARTDLPFTKVKANIAPSIAGTDEVEVYKCGVNLFDKTAITPNTWIIVNSTDTEASNSYSTSDYIPVSAGKRYFVSFKDSNRSAYYDRNKNGIEYFSFNGNASFTALYDGYIRVTIKNDINLDNFIINEGNEEATYEQYSKTTYTADLGEPVYGGYADLVSGTGKTKVYKHTFTGDNLSSVSLNYGTAQEGYTHLYFYTAGIPLAYNPSGSNVISDIGIPWNNNASSSPYPSGECYRVMNTGSGENQRPTVYAYIHNAWSSVDDFKAWLNSNPITIVYEVEAETEFTFDGQVVRVSPGVNNLWNNAGGDTDVEYFEQE